MCESEYELIISTLGTELLNYAKRIGFCKGMLGTLSGRRQRVSMNITTTTWKAAIAGK